jgi:hypothetical protein
VLDGSKTLTVRWDEAITVGPVILSVGPKDDRDVVGATVLEVRRIAAADLSPHDVDAPDDTDMAEYVAQLRDNYYPSMPDDAILDVVRFRVD